MNQPNLVHSLHMTGTFDRLCEQASTCMHTRTASDRHFSVAEPRLRGREQRQLTYVNEGLLNVRKGQNR